MNEFECLHIWPQMPDFTMKPCEKCGAIYAHIQLIDALEDAFEAEQNTNGVEFEYARSNRIEARRRILDKLKGAK